MRRGVCRVLAWAAICVGCAEVPTGTESGNPSVPRVQPPNPVAPPAVPPVLPLPDVQPGPVSPSPPDFPAPSQETDSTDVQSSSDVPTDTSNGGGPPAPPSTEGVPGTIGDGVTAPGSGSQPAPAIPPPIPATGGPTGVNTDSVTDSSGADSRSTEVVDAGDADDVDAGP